MNKVAVVCSEFNKELVEKLYKEAEKEFLKLKSEKSSENLSKTLPGWELEKFWVPGAGEIPQACDWLLKSGKAEGVLAQAVIIRGETSHYDFLCRLLEGALWDLQKTYSKPLVFNVLMTETREQAEKRIHRGAESLKALVQMIALKKQLAFDKGK